MPEQKQKSFDERLMDDLMAEIDADVEAMYQTIHGAEFVASEVDVPEEQYKDFRFRNWGDPEKRVAWAQSMDAETWFREAFEIVAPAASKHVQDEYLKMLRAGVNVTEATRIAQDLHNAEQIAWELDHPDPNAPPPLLAMMEPPAPPMPPEMALPAPPPMDPGFMPQPDPMAGGFVPPGMGV